jgi:hypothetical protein
MSSGPVVGKKCALKTYIRAQPGQKSVYLREPEQLVHDGPVEQSKNAGVWAQRQIGYMLNYLVKDTEAKASYPAINEFISR